jgi:hypothetical protein
VSTHSVQKAHAFGGCTKSPSFGGVPQGGFALLPSRSLQTSQVFLVCLECPDRTAREVEPACLIIWRKPARSFSFRRRFFAYALWLPIYRTALHAVGASMPECLQSVSGIQFDDRHVMSIESLDSRTTLPRFGCHDLCEDDNMRAA